MSDLEDQRNRRRPMMFSQTIALLVAVGVTAIFAAVWITTLPARLSTLQGIETTVDASPVIDSIEALPTRVREAVTTPAATTSANALDGLRAPIPDTVELEADTAAGYPQPTTTERRVIRIATTTSIRATSSGILGE